MADPRIAALLDDRLFATYWDAVDHFGTTDLVLSFETEREVDPVSANRRETYASDPAAPEPLKTKIAKPASEVDFAMKGATTAFWLVVFFPDECVIVSVAAQRIGAGGTA